MITFSISLILVLAICMLFVEIQIEDVTPCLDCGERLTQTSYGYHCPVCGQQYFKVGKEN